METKELIGSMKIIDRVAVSTSFLRMEKSMLAMCIGRFVHEGSLYCLSIAMLRNRQSVSCGSNC